ncbi:MAG: AsmA family protein, partial [Saprospiraceae bacterium]|nr:AsmA family protein [Saprospiraceae bacterium]
MKKVLKFSGLVLILGFVLLAVTPYLFKDRIVTLLKQNLNENLEARTDFDDISLSFFRSFPNLSARISGLRVDGIGAFHDTPLFHAEEISVAIDFWTILGEGPIRITSLQLESPRINILVLADGRANYDIVVSSAEESSDETNGLRFDIDQYELQSAHLRYEDQSLPMILAFDRFDHSGKGDFASMQFDLVTLTEVERFSLIYDGVTYFNDASVHLGATMEMDLDQLRYTLKENKLNLNELELSGEGFIDLNDDDIELDLSFSTSKSDFRQLVSVLPGAYVDDFNQVQIEGTFEAESQISGIYSDDQLPAFN